jgi:hypothetical protein
VDEETTREKERLRAKERRRAGNSRGKHEKAREGGDACDGAARIFTHGHGEFAKCGKMGKRYRELLETSFYLFFPKFHEWGRDMGHSWKCS